MPTFTFSTAVIGAYAFVNISEISSQYELSIFSENLSKFRHLLKEGNLLIFDVDKIEKPNLRNFTLLHHLELALAKLVSQPKI